MRKGFARFAIGTTLITLLAACGSGGAGNRTANAPEPHNPGEPVRVLSAARALELAAANRAGQPKANIELSPEARMLIKRGPDYVPIPVTDNNSQPLFDRLEKSMADRRATAWQIVEKMLAPQKLTFKDKDGKPLKDKDGNEETYDVPLWHTWYEGASANKEVTELIKHFVAKVKGCKEDDECKDTPDKRRQLAKEAVAEFNEKPLAKSTTVENMEQTLLQLIGRNGVKLSKIALPGHLGRGFTLFSPSFVEHMLSQAQGIEQCLDPGHAKKGSENARSATEFSYCLDEFPRSAVMVKASWGKIDPKVALAPVNVTTGPVLSAQMSKMGGQWPEKRELALGNTQNMYAVQTDDGSLYGLNSIHFSTKDTREWIWVTLWWDPKPDTDFGADRPAAITNFNQGVWANYKMCVTTSFDERDLGPWSTFETPAPSLAEALKASYSIVGSQAGAPANGPIGTWCSNPNLEWHTNNDKTNCIGCHQHSLSLTENPAIVGTKPNIDVETDFAETLWLDPESGSPIAGNTLALYRSAYPQLGRLRVRKNFPADFAWSTSMEFRGQIRSARNNAFQW